MRDELWLPRMVVRVAGTGARCERCCMLIPLAGACILGLAAIQEISLHHLLQFRVLIIHAPKGDNLVGERNRPGIKFSFRRMYSLLRC